MNARHSAVAHCARAQTALRLRMLAADRAASFPIGISHVIVVLCSYCTVRLAINRHVGDFRSDAALFPNYFGQSRYYYYYKCQDLNDAATTVARALYKIY